MPKNKPLLVIVSPCYNEQEVLPETAKRLTAVLDRLKRAGRISPQSHLLFVDDGSTDATWDVIRKLKARYRLLKGLKLSKNFGHQQALLAGLMAARPAADCVISLDADLQQDENAIPEFVQRFQEGNQIVYGVRRDRKSDRWFKRWSARFFYGVMHLLGVRVLEGHADYRLVSRKVLDVLTEHGEVMLFLRGIFTTLGFKTAVVYHDVRPRVAGTTKYSLRKMLSFALTGITSFSFTPIRVVGALGLVVAIASGLALLWAGVDALWCGCLNPLALIWEMMFFLFGVQLICLGILGEYVGKVYVEVKKRPKYIIDEEL
jgi:polyisoprenyl-phosphate glycosyltransferase